MKKLDVMIQDQIEEKIFVIRKKKVMLDRDLAGLYGVETKVLNQAVKRNKDRFPEDFMFQISEDETKELVTIFDRLNSMKHSSVNPYVFTGKGVAMLSSVLNRKRTVQVNIAIMRVFVRLREFLSSQKQLLEKVEDLEGKVGKHDDQIGLIFEAIKRLTEPPAQKKRKIGFH